MTDSEASTDCILFITGIVVDKSVAEISEILMFLYILNVLIKNLFTYLNRLKDLDF
ncbi:hypothetical protein MPS01_09990 [Marinilactibacillus psychrotolerans]|uniref:Uncharacterized protein n=1 Tax=Marinilactibacillus psychrotolerans TaxID=191770 RepID=A0AAV3WVQ4_9LACT|nr:hypothetical protein MPS01_09990 [Marinilactibacillus psychrotolerans]GEQ35709.1 hypothetical protein M132T_12170 [Marinilactibacillus psychrotolerans]